MGIIVGPAIEIPKEYAKDSSLRLPQEDANLMFRYNLTISKNIILKDRFRIFLII